MLRACLSAVLLLAACNTGEAPDSDQPAPVPIARTEVAGALWRGRIVVVGGLLADGSASDAAHVYDDGRDRWSRLPSLPVALHHTAAVEFGDRLWVVGGYELRGGQWVASARVFSLGDGEDAWRDEPALPEPRGALAVAAVSDALVAVGGVTNAPTATTALFRGRVWSAGPPLTRAREHLAATAAGGRVFAIAGRAGGTNFTDVESWDAVSPSWRREAGLNDSRGGIGAATVGDAPCVAGGEEEAGTIASVECLGGDRWQRVGRLREPRHGLAVVSLNGRLHVIAGGPTPGLSVSRTHEALDL